MTTSPDDAQQTGSVLELRVHGVNNTSPSGMLDLPLESIEEVLGDNLAGFWRPKLGTKDAVHEGDRGWVPPEVTREAYSWGGLARTTTGAIGTGTLGRVTNGLSRLGWALLLPFGLANVAYWSRQLGDEVAPDDDGATGRRVFSVRQPLDSGKGAGASTVRLFGLGLTLLGVVTACEVSMDLVGKQCFVGQTRVCTALPGIFDVLAPHPAAVRLAVTSLAPVALLIGLWLLSSLTRARYERVTAEGPAVDHELTVEELQKLPFLALPHFWQGDRMVSGLGHLHLAAGLAVVAMNLSWTGLFGATKGCQQANSFFHEACWTQVGDEPHRDVTLFALGTVAALLVLAWAAVLTWLRASDAPDVLDVLDRHGKTRRPSTLGVLGAAGGVLLVAEALVLILAPPLAPETPLPGMRGLPTFVLIALLALVASAFTSRLGRWGPFWAIGLAVSFVLVGLSLWFAILPIGGLAALTVYVLVIKGGVHGERRWTAWAGTGPGMFLGAALLVAGLLTAFVVLGAGDWLNGKNSASSLIDGCGLACPSPLTPLQVPMPYVLIGTGALLALVFLVIVIGAMLFLSRAANIPPEPLDFPPAPKGAPANPAIPVPPAVHDSHVEATLLRSRRTAALAHRAEKTFAFFVLSGLSTMFVVLIYAVNGSVPWSKDWPFLGRVTDLGTAGVSFLALALLAAVVGGAAGKRPLGLIWDLICFLPRAAHPFGPPCYAERAVPELASRVEWWLDDSAGPSEGHRKRGDRVVLSAHSLGGVLAVSSLLARLPRGGWPNHEVRLLTYGSQLRAYFSRIFPELLGPTVLGTPPARAAQFWARNETWWGEATDAHRPPPSEPPGAIVGMLTTKPEGPQSSATGPPTVLWRNLWRRTDYIGFPLWAYPTYPGNRLDPGNVLDAGAEEIDSTGYLVEVVTHGGYPRSEAYRAALIQLAKADP